MNGSRGQTRPGRKKGIHDGCLFALMAGIFPRPALFIVWVARPALVGAAFSTWIVPVLGIVFLPFATLMYVILYVPGVGLTRLGLVLGDHRGALDLAHLGTSIARRRELVART